MFVAFPEKILTYMVILLLPLVDRIGVKKNFTLLLLIVITMTTATASSGFADEEEKRRVDISLSIFPRVVAVDNHFRDKLIDGDEVQLVFLYSKNKLRASELAARINDNGKSIGGMKVIASVKNIVNIKKDKSGKNPTAMFLSERFSDDELVSIMAFAESNSRLVFSPFSGDVERGATVGISVTNRVKPYFNLNTLRRSDIDINALLMKMSKRYE